MPSRMIAGCCLLVLALLAPGATGALHAQDCGPTRKVAGYAFTAFGKRFAFPRFFQIERDGLRIYSDLNPEAWVAPYYGVKTAQFQNLILIQPFYNDCVDVDSARLFILSRSGQLLMKQRLWTQNWAGGFFDAGGRLTYWSEWFCNKANPERRKNKAYVYQYDPGRIEFQKKETALPSPCSEAGIRKLGWKRIEFRPARSL